MSLNSQGEVPSVLVLEPYNPYITNKHISHRKKPTLTNPKVHHSGVQVEEMLSLLAPVDHSEDHTDLTTIVEEYPQE